MPRLLKRSCPSRGRTPRPWAGARTWASLATSIAAVVAPCAAQDESPTAEAIKAYSAACVTRGQRMDLVARFGTDFRGRDLRNIDLRGVWRADKETILTGADFTGADLRGADFGNARLDRAVFRDAKLDNAQLVTARLDGADLAGAALGNARFQECVFTNATLAGVDFSRATINGCRFDGAVLDNAVLQGAQNDLGWRDFSGASLRGVDLSGFDFSHSTLAGADLANADLTGARFVEADLTGANLSGAILDGVVVDAAILDGVTGLDESTVQMLLAEADRAGFEARRASQVATAASRGQLRWWLHIGVVLLAFIFSILAWRRSPSITWPLVLILVNAIALVPPLFFIFLETKGSHAATNPALRELIAGFWITTWPIGVLGSLAVGPGGLVLMSWQLVRAIKGGEKTRGAWLLLTAALLTSLHAALLLLLMFEYAPTV